MQLKDRARAFGKLRYVTDSREGLLPIRRGGSAPERVCYDLQTRGKTRRGAHWRSLPTETGLMLVAFEVSVELATGFLSGLYVSLS